MPPLSVGLATTPSNITGATCKGVSSVALRAPSNTPLHDHIRIEPNILCSQIYALSDNRSQSLDRTSWVSSARSSLVNSI
jgi:hypothetical protein